MAGPQRARLDRALSGALDDQVDTHASEWEKCQGILQQISMALSGASPEVKEKIGGRTGPAVDAALTRSAQRMGEKAGELGEGAVALRNASGAVRTARIEQDDLARHPLSEPPPYRAPVGPPTKTDLRAESQSRQAHASYQAAYADQESRARHQADAMDRVFAQSTATMKKIHGEPDPQQVGPSGGGGSGGSVPSGAGGGPWHTDGPGYHPGPGHVPGSPGGNPGGSPGGAPQGGGPFDAISTPAGGGAPGGSVGAPGSTAGGSIGPGTALGLAGAAGGGVAGGLLGTGLTTGGIRGGPTLVTNPSTAAGGRSGPAPAAGRRGTSGGSRGAAGGRGAGSVASGRGGRGKDDEKRRRNDVFDTGDEWIEDEDAAPGVLD